MAYVNAAQYQQEMVEREDEPSNYTSLTQRREDEANYNEIRPIDTTQNSNDQPRKTFKCKLQLILLIIGMVILACLSSIITAMVLQQKIDNIFMNMTNELQSLRRNNSQATVMDQDDSWSAWGSWGSCSATCNGGTRERHRSCDNQDPSLIGKTCIGNSVESKNCNNKNCPNKLIYFTVTTPNKTLTTNDRPLFILAVGNEGGGYDMSTAIFTCPVAGLYMFSFTIIKYSAGTSCYLYHNSKYVATVITGTDDHYTSATGSVFVRLNKGDTFDARNCNGWNNVYSSIEAFFTGALVTPS